MNAIKTLLVTGGAGFIGLNFVRYWRDRYPDKMIIVLDKLCYSANVEGILEIVDDKLIFIKGCITDSKLVFSILNQYNISHILHFAAESHVDRSIDDPDIFLQTNVMGTLSLLKAAVNYMNKGTDSIHFHHISTDEVYGTLVEDEPGFTEYSRYQPNSPYAASKASSDHLVRAYHVTYGLPITISHCSNNYGPFQYREKLIPLIIRHILEGRSLPIYGDGRNIRDWIYVEDHCRAIDLILSKAKIGETYNVGGMTEIRNIDLVKKICHQVANTFENEPQLLKIFPLAPCAKGLSNESLISYVTDRKGHDYRYAINGSKIFDLLGYKPTHSFEEGLEMTIEWNIHQLIKERKEKDSL